MTELEMIKLVLIRLGLDHCTHMETDILTGTAMLMIDKGYPGAICKIVFNTSTEEIMDIGAC